MRKIEGYSLVEMIITIAIIAVVMLLVGVTLTTLIQASANSSTRTTVREEEEFVLELMRKTIRNSHTDDIYVFNPQNRAYNESSGLIEATGEVSGYDTALVDGEVGTEIHFRPSGFDRWVCIGYFSGVDDPDIGYIFKSSASDLNSNHEACFDSATQESLQNTILLNSNDVDVNGLSIEFYPTVGENMIMSLGLTMEPTHWVERFAGDEAPNVFKQVVVSTQKLTWE
jgi:prepilin-type N-terminal cleavage/methylation domain-containing protein